MVLVSAVMLSTGCALNSGNSGNSANSANSGNPGAVKTQERLRANATTTARLRIDLSRESLHEYFPASEGELQHATLVLEILIDMRSAADAAPRAPSIVSTRVGWERGEPGDWYDTVIDPDDGWWSETYYFTLSSETCTTLRCQGVLLLEQRWHHASAEVIDVELVPSVSVVYEDERYKTSYLSAEELQWLGAQ